MAHEAAALTDVEAEAHAVPTPGLADAETLAATVLVVTHAQRWCHRRGATQTAASARSGPDPPSIFVEKLRQLLAELVGLLEVTGRTGSCWPRTSICCCCFLVMRLEVH